MYKMRFYQTSGINKGNLDHEEFFETREEVMMRYAEVFKKELFSLNPTIWEYDFCNQDYFRIQYEPELVEHIKAEQAESIEKAKDAFSDKDLYGKPIDFVLFMLEQKANKLGKELENHAEYIHLCSLLTKLDFDEPISFKDKEWMYKALMSIIKWVLLGECISDHTWYMQTLEQYYDMRNAETLAKYF